MFDVTALGEVLIDFTSIGLSENNMRIFEQNLGGAPANVACAVARLGLNSAFIGKVGEDMHGKFLKTVLKDCGVSVLGLVMDKDVLISYDPNYRQMLWEGEKEAKKQMRSVLPYVDIIKISDEETSLLTDYKDPYQAAKALIKKGISLVLITLGEEGALVGVRDRYEIVPAFKGKVIDTTGAGDSFFGAYLYNVAKDKANPKDISFEKAAEYARFANAAASLCIQKRGAINAMPNLEEIEKVI